MMWIRVVTSMLLFFWFWLETEESLDETELPQEKYFRAAKRLDATRIRLLLQDPNVDPNAHANDCSGGALHKILNSPAESAEMLDSVRAVLEHKDADPNSVGDVWPPLKIALARGHHEAAQVLLNHPRTKKEIDPAGLSCEIIAQLPDEVRLSSDPQCMCNISGMFDGFLEPLQDWCSSEIESLLEQVAITVFYLGGAEDLKAARIRRFLRNPNADPNFNDCKGGALHRILNRSTQSARMLDALKAVLEHKDADPNGVGSHWPQPLKIALARGHRVAANILLNHPKTKKEIDPAGLSCEIIAQLPDEVRLAYHPNAPQCMRMIRTTFDNITHAFLSIGIILEELWYDVCGWFLNILDEYPSLRFWCIVISFVSDMIYLVR